MCLYAFPDKSPHMLCLHAFLLHGLGRYLAAALDGPQYYGLIRSSPSRARLIILSLVSLPGFSAYPCFVHFDYSGEKAYLVGLRHGLSYLHRYPPCRIFIHTQIAGNLKRGYPLLGVQDEIDCEDPFLKGHMGTVKDRPNCYREACFAVIASVALSMDGSID